jgi:hypothetical protein
MGQARLTILLVLILFSAGAQQADFDFNKIRFKKLGFSETKEAIIRSVGQPKIMDVNYECGFYAKDHPDGPYHQLQYKGFNYIGNDKEDFVLENVSFDVKGKVKLEYGTSELSGLTTKPEFIKMFGEMPKKHFIEPSNKESILLFSRENGDGAMFTFQDGKLIKYSYWSPC